MRYGLTASFSSSQVSCEANSCVMIGLPKSFSANSWNEAKLPTHVPVAAVRMSA